MLVLVYFHDDEVGLSSVDLANCCALVAWFIYTSGLDPRHVGVGATARIYLDEQVGLSSRQLGHFVRARTFFLGQGRLDSQPC